MASSNGAVGEAVGRQRKRSGNRLGVSSGHDHYKWWALSCTSLGILMATVNSGTLIIALPDLERHLHTSVLTLVWVIIAYMISSTVLVLGAGRLSDQFGRKNAYVAGFVVFGLASLGAGFSSSGLELILWRIVAGFGGAFLMANGTAIVTDAFPHEELGLAMGTNSMVAGVGLVIGPVLGGWLVDLSWHWVFWFNVPMALVGSVWGYLVLHELSGRSSDTDFDVPGVITFMIGLTGLVLGISKGGMQGWNDTLVIVSLVAAVVFLPLFVLIELRAKEPMLDLSIFKSRLFSTASAAAFLNGLARFALMFLFVFYFQGVQGDSPVTAGVKLAPMAIAMLIASPIAGRWADRHGSRYLSSAGQLVTAIALALMTTLGEHTSYAVAGAFLFLVGIGSGMFASPNTAAMMGAVPQHRRGIASGARTLIQNTGSGLSVAFVMSIVTSAIPKSVLFTIFSGLGQKIDSTQMQPFLSNVHTAMWWMCVMSLIGAVISVTRPNHGTKLAEETAHEAAGMQNSEAEAEPAAA